MHMNELSDTKDNDYIADATTIEEFTDLLSEDKNLTVELR